MTFSDTVHEIMKDNAPGGFEYRWSGRRTKIVRKNLVSLSVFHEVNMDGHEKLSSKALRMGGASIPIYGIREKYSGALLHLICVPNARLAVAIGHVYLDFVETYKGKFKCIYPTTLSHSFSIISNTSTSYSGQRFGDG